MTRARRIAALCLGLVVTAELAAPSARAAELGDSGWWWRAQQDPAATVPQPPTVPSGGLMVQGAPDGPSAVGALRFAVDAGDTDPVLTLRIDENGSRSVQDTILLACSAASPWSGGEAQRWSERPEADCATSVQAEIAADGRTVTLALGALLAGRVLDIVLVPGTVDGLPASTNGSTFTLVFEPPQATDLITDDRAGPRPGPAPSAATPTDRREATTTPAASSAPVFSPPPVAAPLPSASAPGPTDAPVPGPDGAEASGAAGPVLSTTPAAAGRTAGTPIGQATVALSLAALAVAVIAIVWVAQWVPALRPAAAALGVRSAPPHPPREDRVSAPLDRLRGAADDDRVRRTFDVVGGALVAFWAWRLVAALGWSLPPGIVVKGAVIGGLTALIAFGIALVYRANRIVNFAQAELGAVPAALAVLLIVGPQVPYALAMGTGLVAGVVLGAVIELVIIRRFFKAPRLILTVATIGIANILAFGEIALPDLFDLTIPPQSFPSPFDFSFTVEPIIFHGNDVVAMAAVPLVIVALTAFFRYTNTGIAVRASAESADRAALLGVPVKRVETAVWVVATVLATIAILLRAGIVGLPIGQVLGPAILLRALAAAVIGRMERLPVILAAAIGLGIVEQTIVWNTGRSILVDPILFVVVLGALVLQRLARRREATRVDDAGGASNWQTAEIRPIPRELARLPEVVWGARGLRWTLMAFLALLPVLLSESRINLVGVIVIFAIIGVSLVILTGWAGQVSLGQMAFVGVGAAVAGALTSRLGWDLALGIVVAGLVGAAVAVAIGIPALRVRGLFLAVTTLAFALAASSYLLNPEFAGWLPSGRVERLPLLGAIPVASEDRFYYVALLGLALAYGGARNLRRSRTGRVLIAARDNDRALAAYGVAPTRARLTAFALSGFFAAYAGALFVYHQQSLGISPFLPEESLRVFTMVVIGGLGSLPGALLGAVYLQGTEYFLPRTFAFLASGVGVLAILLVIPNGLGSVVYAVRDRLLRLVANRRGVLVPSLVADARRADNGPIADADAPMDAALSGDGHSREELAALARRRVPLGVGDAR